MNNNGNPNHPDFNPTQSKPVSSLNLARLLAASSFVILRAIHAKGQASLVLIYF